MKYKKKKMQRAQTFAHKCRYIQPSLSPLLVVGYWWTVTNFLSVPTTTTDLKSKKWSTLGLKILHLTFR